MVDRTKLEEAVEEWGESLHEPGRTLAETARVLLGFPRPEDVEALAFALGGTNPESYRGVATLALDAVRDEIFGGEE